MDKRKNILNHQKEPGGSLEYIGDIQKGPPRGKQKQEKGEHKSYQPFNLSPLMAIGGLPDHKLQGLMGLVEVHASWPEHLRLSKKNTNNPQIWV